MKNVTISTRKRLFSDDSMMALSMAGLQTECGIRNSECGMRNGSGEWRRIFRCATHSPFSPFRIPHSEFRIPHTGSIFLGLVLKDELRLELVGAAGNHDIALLQSRLDDDAVAGVAASLDGQERERVLVRRGRTAGLGGNKDPALALDLDHA